MADRRVRVIASQVIQKQNLKSFLAEEGFESWQTDAEQPSEMLVEVAGRICYMSFDRGRSTHEEYVGNIIEKGHGSVIEHAVLTFLLTGVSRTLAQELLRHRAGLSPSMLSQRFVDERAAQFVCPDLIRSTKDHPVYGWIFEAWVKNCEAQVASYKTLQEGLLNFLAMPSGEPCSDEHREATKKAKRKKINSAARSIMPQATETKLVITVNARALRNIFDQRATPEADDEIRGLALDLFEAATPHIPDLLRDYEVYEHEEEGTCLRTAHRKV